MIKKLGVFFVVIMLFITAACSDVNSAVKDSDIGSVQGEFRGIWVSTVMNLDYPSAPGADVEKLKEEADYLLDNAKSMGMNAIVLQVRPCGDAIYPSELYPWSAYISGEQGVAPEKGFDPLEYWVEQAHARGMELHAWINPFRVTHGGSEEKPKTDVTLLAQSNPARINPDWTVEYKGNLYLNPGIEQVREYIIKGVKEIVDNYPVDGIHFDDYFYPGVDFSDDHTFSMYGGEFADIADWRRDNVNKLVRRVYEVVHGEEKQVRFGISPFGIWKNKASDPEGSDTRGLEAYHTYYADSRAWVKNGWVDYIAPQIYWSIGNGAADYSKLLSWWVDTVKGTDVDLYIGHAGYRSLEAQPGDVWYGSDEIERQIRLNRRYDEVKGSIHFRIKMYIDNPTLTEAIKNLYITD